VLCALRGLNRAIAFANGCHRARDRFDTREHVVNTDVDERIGERSAVARGGGAAVCRRGERFPRYCARRARRDVMTCLHVIAVTYRHMRALTVDDAGSSASRAGVERVLVRACGRRAVLLLRLACAPPIASGATTLSMDLYALDAVLCAPTRFSLGILPPAPASASSATANAPPTPTPGSVPATGAALVQQSVRDLITVTLSCARHGSV
jgi:hypothetical protein